MNLHERCSACGKTHERDNCPEALARSLERERALEREPLHDWEGAILARDEEDRL